MAKILVVVESGNRTAEQLERWVRNTIKKSAPTDIAVYVPQQTKEG